VRFLLIVLLACSLLFACAVPTASAQSGVASPPMQGVGPGQQPGPRDQAPGGDDELRVKMEKDMAKKANQERQAQLKRDTEQLFKLATDLKDEVDKSNENLLSLEVIKKAEEIERLAHSIKDKMKGN
jgi:hypothetical protein